MFRSQQSVLQLNNQKIIVNFAATLCTWLYDASGHRTFFRLRVQRVQALPEAFLHGSIFDRTAFCFGEKQGMLVNDECSRWCNRVGNFLVSIWDRRKQLLYIDGSACMARQNNPTPLECVVNVTECYDGWVWAIYWINLSIVVDVAGAHKHGLGS